MKIKYAHNKRDRNEGELVETASHLGAAWREGPPLDGWIWWRGRWLPVEIKLPQREGLAHEYTPAQRRFFSWCGANSARWLVWRSAEDVIRDLNAQVTA